MNSTSDTVACSLVKEFNNTSSSPAYGDWIFFSIGNFAGDTAPLSTNSNCWGSVDGTNGNRGCMVGINITNASNPAINPAGAWPPGSTFFTAQGVNNNANAVALRLNNAGCSSGIIVDNVSEASQTSNIYFSVPNSPGTAPGLPS
jgi:hypothetical protein